MTGHYDKAGIVIHHGDCLDVLRELPDASVDSVVTDPPYSYSFMARHWDSHPTPLAFQQWCQQWATECLRVMKPGAHLLAFGGTRTSHRLACAIEDAGFEIRDSIAWLYGSGFPKSLDVGKAIDRAAGAEREVVGSRILRGRAAQSTQDKGGTYTAGAPSSAGLTKVEEFTAPATDAARQWHGWGTALKPAHEPIVVARKPLAGTVAANVLAHGTGALNVDGCRVGDGARPLIVSKSEDSTGILGNGLNGSSHGGSTTAGRWPANVVLDEDQAAALDAQSGELHSQDPRTRRGSRGESRAFGQRDPGDNYGDTGGASRFFKVVPLDPPRMFYTAKAGAGERPRVAKAGAGEGRVTGLGGKIRECNVCGTRAINSGAAELTCGHADHTWIDNPRAEHTAHPTVKPLALMRWLVRLVTLPGGTVLEPFAGSGTTVEAALLEGFACIAVEREAEYLPLIVQRINRRRDPIAHARDKGEDLGLFGLDDPEETP